MSTDIVLPDDMTLEICKNVLRSPYPDKDMMTKILDAGIELTVDECVQLCKVSNVVNGYVFTKYMNSQGLKLYKFINDKKQHNGHTYVHGFNCDYIPFSPYSQCSAGGLYFTDTQNILHFRNFGATIHRVFLYSYSRVYLELYKYKTDQFYIDLNTVIPIELIVSKLKINVLDLMYQYEDSRKFINKYIDFVNLKQVSQDFFTHFLLYNYHDPQNWFKHGKESEHHIHRFIRKFTSDELLDMIKKSSIIKDPAVLLIIPGDLLTEDFCIKFTENYYEEIPHSNSMQTITYENFLRGMHVVTKRAHNGYGTIYSPEFREKLHDICIMKID